MVGEEEAINLEEKKILGEEDNLKNLKVSLASKNKVDTQVQEEAVE